MTDRNENQPTDQPPAERIADRFPLSRWVTVANFAKDGMSLPGGVNWDAYTVELIERPTTSDDTASGSRDIPSGSFTWEGAEVEVELNPDGTLRTFHASGGEVWRHVGTLIRHPDAAAVLQWEWDGSAIGRIAIVGLATDPNADRSCAILVKAIQLLRDFEWRGEGKPGQPSARAERITNYRTAILELHRAGYPGSKITARLVLQRLGRSGDDSQLRDDVGGWREFRAGVLQG